MINLTFPIPGKFIKVENQTMSYPFTVKSEKGDRITKQVEIYHAPLVQISATQKTVISDEAQEFFQKLESRPACIKPKEWNSKSAIQRLEFHLYTIAGSWDFSYEFIK